MFRGSESWIILSNKKKSCFMYVLFKKLKQNFLRDGALAEAWTHFIVLSLSERCILHISVIRYQCCLHISVIRYQGCLHISVIRFDYSTTIAYCPSMLTLQCCTVKEYVPRYWRTPSSCQATTRPHRSEERRVGKECRSRWCPDH